MVGSTNENTPPAGSSVAASGSVLGKRPGESSVSLQRGGKRGSRLGSDPLIGYGRHCGRTLHTFCNFAHLFRDGIMRVAHMKLHDIPVSELTESAQKEHRLFEQVFQMYPDIEARICGEDSTVEDITHCGEMLNKGASSARSDDTKNLKTAVIDWITPAGGVLVPPIARNSKTNRGFQHDTTGRYLCPTDYDWSDANTRSGIRSGKITVLPIQFPAFLYPAFKFNSDNMWEGFMRSTIMLSAYKSIFTSPSSADGETRATRSGNAQLHGMKHVTASSLAYVATLVRFSLSEAQVFNRQDKVLEPERFYGVLLEVLEDPLEQVEVKALLEWWDQAIFPNQTILEGKSIPATCGIAQMKQRRQRILQEAADNALAANE